MYDYIATNAEAMRQYLADSKIDKAAYKDLEDAYCHFYDDDKLFELMMSIETPNVEDAVTEHLKDLYAAAEFFSIPKKEIDNAIVDNNWGKLDSIIREYLRHDAIISVLNEFYST